jgi:hypothetical protein
MSYAEAFSFSNASMVMFSSMFSVDVFVGSTLTAAFCFCFNST